MLLVLLITENKLERRKMFSQKCVRTAEILYIPNYLCVFMKHVMGHCHWPGDIEVAQTIQLLSRLRSI